MSQAFEWLRLGGPAMAVLVAMSVAAVTLVIVKVWEFYEFRLERRGFVAPALDAWQHGRAELALSLLAAEPSPLAEVMRAAMTELKSAREPLADVRERVAQLAADRLAACRSLLRPLEVIGQLAPLTGLLGTVLGMIQAFQNLQAAGDRVDPSILSGGIWQALLTTAAGLIIAIPTVAALHWLDRRVERLHGAMESALTRVFTRLAPPSGDG